MGTSAAEDLSGAGVVGWDGDHQPELDEIGRGGYTLPVWSDLPVQMGIRRLPYAVGPPASVPLELPGGSSGDLWATKPKNSGG